MTTCPPDAVVTALGATFEPLVKRQIEAELQSNTLATLRDTLLPKLISGELRLKDAERFLARAT
jgi:type I restriction enzyme S subunit